MAYVAVKGGEAAVAESLRLLKEARASSDTVSLQALMDAMPLLIEQVMSEAALYAPDYAALALKQAMGSVEEAVFLLRAYRSTLRRSYYTSPISTEDMQLTRKISSIFKDIPGGQILGATFDYSHRLLDFSLRDGAEPSTEEEDEYISPEPSEAEIDAFLAAGMRCQRATAVLSEETRKTGTTAPDEMPFDITTALMRYPAPRSARLQALARSEPGFVGGVAFANLRGGFGSFHSAVGDLRVGLMPVYVPHPLYPGEEICLGEITLTDVHTLCPAHGEDAEEGTTLVGGYGCSFGRGETKVIAMSVVDAMLNMEEDTGPLDDEFILSHGDSVEMNGFISHLKLPHYVTFQSSLDRIREGSHEKA